MKKLFIAFLVFLMCTSITTTAYAAKEKVTKEVEIISIAELYGVSVIIRDADDKSSISMNRDEIISLFKKVSTSNGSVYNVSETIIKPGIPTKGEASHTFSQWRPFEYFSYLGAIFGVAVCRNVQFDYNYSYPPDGVPSYTGYRNITSWLSGVAVEGWTQTGSSVNFSTTINYYDTASVSVTGYPYIGIEYEGVQLSLQMPPETWNFTLRLIP